MGSPGEQRPAAGRLARNYLVPVDDVARPLPGHEDPLPEEDLDSLPAWKARRRQRLVALLGQMPEPVPLDLETLESVQCDGYRRDKVVFDSEETMSVPAYLLVPDGRVNPGAAVLACHGHGPGKSQVVGLEHTNQSNGDYASSWSGRATWCWRPTSAVSGSARTGTPTTTTPATPTSSTR